MDLVLEDCVTDGAKVLYPVIRTDSGVYTTTPSGEVYIPLLEAFTHFNTELFDGKLPDCLVTIRAKGRTQGFYHAKRFAALKSKATADEIALNPAYFPIRSLIDTASTLVHEMSHHWQEHFGTPPRSGYHNKEWAARMRSIGLMPSDTEAPGGKETGDSVSHYILEDGLFARSYTRLEATGWQIGWGDASAKKPRATRVKFICPGGCLNIPAPRSVEGILGCFRCNRPLIIQELS
jgi:hypothetical protein